MRRFDKAKHIEQVNHLSEQRYLASKGFITEDSIYELGVGDVKQGAKDMGNKLKDFMGSNLPKVKDNSEQAVLKAREEISKAYGFGVDQWSDPENQAKMKTLFGKLKSMISSVMSAGVDVIKDPKKLSALLTTLNFAQYAALIKGVWDLVFVTSIDFSFFGGSTAVIGGMFFFKLAIFLFAVRLVLKIIGGTITLKNIGGDIVSFIKNFISIFTGKKNAAVESVGINESVIILFETYGYPKTIIN